MSNGISILAALLACACVQPPANGAGTGDSTPQLPGAGSGSQEADWAAIVRLEDQAKAIVRSSGCSSVSQCRTAPVGNRACGGPRYYLAYCATTTDSAALFRQLDQVAAAENEYNRKYGIVSTCELRMPLALTLVGGECRGAGR